MENIFVNYQINKLNILFPNFVNLTIILIFLGTIVASLQRVEQPVELLSRSQTEQLKGLAIFFVVLGHLWVHVAQKRPSFIFSGDAVFLFLFLSGFGLTCSNLRTRISFRSFCTKRVTRVLKPYWIITFFVLMLDFVILEKSYSGQSLVMTFFGVNITSELRHMDYARWFVTFILFWYLLFYVTNLFNSPQKASFLLLSAGFIILPIHYYFFDFGWYQFLSFPLGSISAVYYKRINKIFNQRKLSVFCSYLGMGYVLVYYTLMGDEELYRYIYDVAPNILLEYHSEVVSLLLTASVILIFADLGRRRLSSRILAFFGQYSYEIFLLHGIFLIKYNPIIKHDSVLLVVIEFFIFLFFILAISWLLSIVMRQLTK